MGAELDKSQCHNEFDKIFKKYSPYYILGVAENSDMDIVLPKYKMLIKKYHPDKCINNDQNLKKFKLVQCAFNEILMRKDNKTHYELKKGYQDYVKKIEPSTFIKKDISNSQSKNNNIELSSNGENDVNFSKKFNEYFDKNKFKSDSECDQDNGYNNADWDSFATKEKKYELISYDDINYLNSSSINYEEYDTNFKSNNKGVYTKYSNTLSLNPNNNLQYTDYLYAYTDGSMILPNEPNIHEKIWDLHYRDYHHRDFKTLQEDRKNIRPLSEEEQKKIEISDKLKQQDELERQKRWKELLDKQEKHYMSVNKFALLYN